MTECKCNQVMEKNCDRPAAHCLKAQQETMVTQKECENAERYDEVWTTISIFSEFFIGYKLLDLDVRLDRLEIARRRNN